MPETRKIKPPIRKRKPPVIKHRRRPPEKNVLPDTLYDDTDLSPQKNDSVTNNDNLTNKGHPDDLPSSSSSPDPRSFLFDKKTIEKYARKGPPVDKGLTFDISEFKHRGYMRMLKEKIENIWKYPEEAARLGRTGDLYVRFLIKRDGRLGEVNLLRTSGYKDLDEAAIKAVKDAEPYWPLPEDWEKDDLEIRGHFIYIFGRTYAL